MKIGIFDHLDTRDIDLSQFYEDRLALVSTYDQIVFHAYHVAEHHFTPLGLSPSPSVYLSAVAQKTKRILFGLLVYTLPLYHPLRLADEIFTLDHMSKGRLQLGNGRGVSPFEVGYFGVENDRAQSIYLKSFEILMRSLTQSSVSFRGEHFEYRNVPIVLKPFQKSHPPLWYGVGNPQGVDWCITNNVNAVVNGPIDKVRQTTDRFRQRWLETGKDHLSMPLIGISRHVVISESEKEAEVLAKSDYEKWYSSFMHLFTMHNSKLQFKAFPSSYVEARNQGLSIAGKPNTISDYLEHEIRKSGVNYLLTRFTFGNLSLEQAIQSTQLFARHVMPGLLALHL